MPTIPTVPFHARDTRLSPRALHALIDQGKIERIGHGLYLPTGLDGWEGNRDLLEIALRATNATVCLTSALAHYQLIDYVPAATDLALPRGVYRPRLSAPVEWHAFDPDTYDLGHDNVMIEGTDATYRIYSPERTIADAFRMRGYTGYETAIEALRTWLEQPGNSPSRLLTIARQLPRTMTPLRTALEHLT